MNSFEKDFLVYFTRFVEKVEYHLGSPKACIYLAKNVTGPRAKGQISQTLNVNNSDNVCVTRKSQKMEHSRPPPPDLDRVG